MFADGDGNEMFESSVRDRLRASSSELEVGGCEV